jgi:hypothetical protein
MSKHQGYGSYFFMNTRDTNSAGTHTKTVNFEFKSLCKKYEDTYRQDSPFAKPVVISTKEIK